jgi:hypothetical protein
MDALVIGPPRDLTAAVARSLRRTGRRVLQAIPADAEGGERARWLLDEAGRPPLVVILDDAPYATLHELLPLTHAEVVLVVEQRAPAANAARRGRGVVPRDTEGLTVVPLGRAGRRWFRLDSARRETLSAERAAALVVRACRTPSPLPAL